MQSMIFCVACIVTESKGTPKQRRRGMSVSGLHLVFRCQLKIPVVFLPSGDRFGQVATSITVPESAFKPQCHRCLTVTASSFSETQFANTESTHHCMFSQFKITDQQT